jgi:hypothetical protein
MALGQGDDGAEQVCNSASSGGQQGGGHQEDEALKRRLGEDGSMGQEQRFGFSG